jgi:hypothetical protein
MCTWTRQLTPVTERQVSDKTDIKEALWVTAMAVIGLLFLIVFRESGEVMATYAETGEVEISIVYWLLVAAFVFLCALIPVLLRDSEPLFKVIAIALTAIAPAVTMAFVVANLWRLTH